MSDKTCDACEGPCELDGRDHEHTEVNCETCADRSAWYSLDR